MRASWLPETRQFSQADAAVVQRPEGLDANGSEGVQPKDVRNKNVEKYSELQVTPGRWDEAWAYTNALQATLEGSKILIEKDLAFTASSFLIDNWTNQWLYEPNLKRFVPAYSGGWVFTIPNGFQKARIEIRSPIAYTPAAAIAGEFVWMGWHEGALPPATGILTLTKTPVVA